MALIDVKGNPNTSDKLRKACIFKFFLKKDDKKQQVCREMFLNMFGISVDEFREITKDVNPIHLFPNLDAKSRDNKGRRKSEDRNPDDAKNLQVFSESILKVLSHCCRRKPKKCICK